MTTEQFEQEIREIDGTKIRLTTYKIGGEYYCHVTNVDPDATIARASAVTREDAVKEAVKKASERIVRYRR